MIPIGPMRDEIGIGNQNTWGICMGFENTDRFTRLDKQGFIVFECAECCNDPVKTFPVARCTPDPAIDNKFAGLFRNAGIQIIHEHAQWRFRQPALGC